MGGSKKVQKCADIIYGWSQIAYEDDDETSEDRKDSKRNTFQKNLEKNGLQLEIEPAEVCILFFLSASLVLCGPRNSFLSLSTFLKISSNFGQF